VKILVLINKVANKDSATILWKIVADNICLVLDCYSEILHAGREVVKLCSHFRVTESCAVMMSLKLFAMLLATCLLVLAMFLTGNCYGHIL
jgi:hypothetical protein